MAVIRAKLPRLFLATSCPARRSFSFLSSWLAASGSFLSGFSRCLLFSRLSRWLAASGSFLSGFSRCLLFSRLSRWLAASGFASSFTRSFCLSLSRLFSWHNYDTSSR